MKDYDAHKTIIPTIRPSLDSIDEALMKIEHDISLNLDCLNRSDTHGFSTDELYENLMKLAWYKGVLRLAREEAVRHEKRRRSDGSNPEL